MQQTESLRIFNIISQIEQTLEESPRPKLSGGGNRRTVDIDLLFDLLGDLKVTIPEDIRRANSVLIEADTLLEHANEEADEIVANAQQEADSVRQQATAASEEMRIAAQQEYEARVAEHEILVEAQRRAELLQQHAEHNANVVYYGAKQYADDLLQDVQRYLMEYHSMVAQNRAELGVGAPPQPSMPSQTQQTQQQPPFQQSAQRPVQAPVQPQQPPVAPSAPPYASQDDEEEEEEPRKRWSLFGRKRREYEDDFEDDDQPFEDEEEEPVKRRRKRGHRHDEDDNLDMDLDE